MSLDLEILYFGPQLCIAKKSVDFSFKDMEGADYSS